MRRVFKDWKGLMVYYDILYCMCVVWVGGSLVYVSHIVSCNYASSYSCVYNTFIINYYLVLDISIYK